MSLTVYNWRLLPIIPLKGCKLSFSAFRKLFENLFQPLNNTYFLHSYTEIVCTGKTQQRNVAPRTLFLLRQYGVDVLYSWVMGVWMNEWGRDIFLAYLSHVLFEIVLLTFLSLVLWIWEKLRIENTAHENNKIF